MNAKLTFTPADFDSFKSFEKAVKKQLGNNIYVGPNSLCLYFDYPKELCAVLRPVAGNTYMEPAEVKKLLEQPQLEFNLESSCPEKK